ncbi:MAG: DUF4922 domain-containing protein [Acidobacteriota bacterium]
MSWDDRLISTTELGTDARELRDNYSIHAEALIRQQTEAWPMLRDAMAALAQAKTQSFSVKGTKVLAQFNPARIVSTGAKVDAATIKQRPCFLCADNLPPEEKGIAFGRRLVILCNPFPVLHNHLVITSREHTPQAIDGNFAVMLDLARALGEDWFVLYNGPRCGASAPDHLHFQACSRADVPLFDDFGDTLRRDSEDLMETTQFGYRINLYAFGSAAQRETIDRFEQAVEHLKKVTSSDGEPMMNLIVTYQSGKWTAFILPRSKHRPASYYEEGNAKLTVSPAAIDLAGVMVVPEPEHFQRITAKDLERIYAEVTLDEWRFIKWGVLLNDRSGVTP